LLTPKSSAQAFPDISMTQSPDGNKISMKDCHPSQAKQAVPIDFCLDESSRSLIDVLPVKNLDGKKLT
jgi:hypothetical protein